MSKIGMSCAGADHYIPGKYAAGANNSLNAPAAINFVEPSGWLSTNNFSVEVLGTNWDHMHFLSSNVEPTKNQLAAAPYIKNTGWILLPLIEGQNSFYFIEHNEFHQPKGHADDIKHCGPIQIDNSAPVCSLVVASGVLRIEERNTSAIIEAFDSVSGVSKVFLDGDIEDGPMVRQWVNFESDIEVQLTEQFGRKRVTVAVMDAAQNVSQSVFDEVFFGSTKYFFYDTKNFGANKMSSPNKKMLTDNSNIFKQDTTNSLSTGEQHGKFQSD